MLRTSSGLLVPVWFSVVAVLDNESSVACNFPAIVEIITLMHG